jgi:hypothetical protein
VFGGWGVVIYLALWIVMPQESLMLPPPPRTAEVERTTPTV